MAGMLERWITNGAREVLNAQLELVESTLVVCNNSRNIIVPTIGSFDRLASRDRRTELLRLSF